MIAFLWELVTRRPYLTTRSAAAEFGPTLATRYPELADYSDAELMSRDRDELLAEIRLNRALGRALQDGTRRTEVEVTR